MIVQGVGLTPIVRVNKTWREENGTLTDGNIIPTSVASKALHRRTATGGARTIVMAHLICFWCFLDYETC